MNALKWAVPAAVIAVSAAAGFALYVPVGAISDAPAAQVAQMGGALDSASSLARGSARLNADFTPPNQQITWKITRPGVTPFGPRYDLSLSGAVTGSARLTLAPMGPNAVIDQAQITAPAGALLGQNAQRLGGQIRVELARAKVSLPDRQLLALEGRAEWPQATVLLDQPVRLGTVHADLIAPKDNLVRLSLRAMGGEVRVSGTADFDLTKRQISLDLQAEPAPEAGPAALAVLQSWGTAQGDGFVIRQTVPLP